MNGSETDKQGGESSGHDKHILVAVLTTGGRWPETGFERVALNEPVDTVLKRTRHQLHLVGVVDWLAVVGDKTLDVNRSFSENGLSGQIVIQYGPPAGGGGCA